MQIKKERQVNAQRSGGFFNTVKWLLAIALVVFSVVGNIYFSSYPAPIRAVVIIFAMLLALLVLATTSGGKKGLDFFKQARIELRKVVWPTRQETIQTTIMVACIVVLMALILWGFDSIFATLVSHLIGA